MLMQSYIGSISGVSGRRKTMKAVGSWSTPHRRELKHLNKTRAEKRRGQAARQGRHLLAAYLAPGEQVPLRVLLERVASEERAQ